MSSTPINPVGDTGLNASYLLKKNIFSGCVSNIPFALFLHLLKHWFIIYSEVKSLFCIQSLNSNYELLPHTV